MLKPPAANMPGVTDTLEFVKNLWGSMNLPGANLSGMAAPPMSADDLDKRIADLKAVESWLNMNLAMLRGTIQTMEVQRATLSTLNAMGNSMAEAMRQSGMSAEKLAAMPFGAFFGQAPQSQQPAPPDTAEAAPAALAWWNTLQDQFRQAVANATGLADAAPEAPADAQAARSGPPDPASPPSPPAADAAPKARGPRPRTDKA